MTLVTILLMLVAQPSAAGSSPPPRAGLPQTVLFISPMGEPFRLDPVAADAVARWFAGADADRDGAISLAELREDAARFFTSLDVNADGEIDPAELARYENEVAPEVQLGLQMRGRGGFGARARWRGRGQGWAVERGGGPRGGFDEGLEGAGRFSFLNIPEPVIAADADLNRGVSRAEFLRAAGERFLLLDKDGDGRLTRAELPRLPERHGRGKRRRSG